MANHLPPELVYLIRDELRGSDPLTIQSASLIRRDFHIPCQQLLYKRFSLTLKDGIRAVERLQGLATSSRLVSYIRDFRLSLPWSASAANFDSRVTWVTVYGDLLSRVLGTLSIDQIEKFEILNWFDLCRFSPLDTEECRAVRARLRATVERITGGASLKKLYAKDMCISALRGCSPSLRCLVLEGAYPADLGEVELFQDVDLQAAKVCLESLTINSTPSEPSNESGDARVGLHQYLLHPKGPFDLGFLDHLSWMKNPFDGLADIMAAPKSGLRSLELDLGYESTSNGKFGRICNVRHFTVHLNLRLDVRSYASLPWLVWLSHELSKAAQGNTLALKTMCIMVGVPTESDYRQPPARYSWGPLIFACRSLDVALGNQSFFPELKEVEFRVSARPSTTSNEDGQPESDIVRAVQENIYAGMPGLKNRDMLKVVMDSEGQIE
ncbi:hypothetical protein BKA70DRAFT_1290924 [Coprinopsis sp. MPI-PUGE-AT-0042]|nr:hypothetical protein BKA70DRAFT_1290924 [Coprinopsis sp. MPI-PUGE-AT-0042]